MTEKKWIGAVAIVSVVLIGLLSGSILLQTGQPTGNTVEITDMLGRQVEVPDEAQEVAGLGIGAIRTLVYLETTDRIVGSSATDKKLNDTLPYLLAHPEITALPEIESSESVNLESIVSLSPDVIIASYYSTADADRIQEDTGIPVVVVRPGEGASEPLNYSSDTNDFYQSLRIVGNLTNKQDRAEDIVSYIKSLVDDLEQKTGSIAEGSKPNVYVGGLSRKGSHGLTMTQWKYPPFVLTHSKNVAGDIQAPSNTIEIDSEQLISWDPDIIFVDEVNLPLVLQDITDPKFSNLTAVINEEVYGVFPYPRYGLNHGVVFANSYYVGKVLYPDQFSDTNVTEKAGDIFSFLVGEPVYDIMKENMGGYMRLDIE